VGKWKMWTDWTQIDPYYFYQRGAIFGFVAASLIWLLIMPSIKRWIKKNIVS